MKDKKESKIRFVLVFMIFLVVLIAFIYLQQHKDILKEKDTPSTVAITQTESSTTNVEYTEEQNKEEMTTAPHDISNWEMQSPSNIEPDTGETIFVQ